MSSRKKENKTLTLKSPAKLNLYLDVLRRRPDGYHDIITCFERIDLADRITLTPASFGIRLTANTREIPWDETNLAFRAAEAILRKTGTRRGVRIHLHKQIPVAAGLGGGSSNAATVLLGLNRLFRLGLSRKALLILGRHLGADVPFFLLETPFAMGQKRGDQVRPIQSPLKISHLIVNNRVKLSTQGVYQQGNFTLTRKRPDVKILQRFLERGNLRGLVERCYNALEPPAAKSCPEILEMKKALQTMGLEGVGLSGSGPTVFGFAKNLHHAKRMRRTILSKHDWDVFICQTY